MLGAWGTRVGGRVRPCIILRKDSAKIFAIYFRRLRLGIFLIPIIGKVMPHAVGAHQVDFHLGILYVSYIEGPNQTQRINPSAEVLITAVKRYIVSNVDHC